MKRIFATVVIALCPLLGAFAAISYTDISDVMELTSELNVAGTVLRVAGTEAVLKLSGAADAEGVFTIRPSFYLPSGTKIVVDASGVDGLTTVRLYGGGLRGTAVPSLTWHQPRY